DDLGEGLFGRALIDGHVDRHALAVADELDRDARVDRRVGDEEGDGLVGRHLLVVDPDDDVALLDSGARSGSARDDGANQLTAAFGEAERGGDRIVVERLEANAEIAALRALA